MEIVVFVLVMLVFTGCLAFGLGYALPFREHKDYTVKFSERWDYGTFESFKKEFNSQHWTITDEFDLKAAYCGTHSRVSDKVIKFHNKGMVIRGLDFFRTQRFIKDYFRRKADKRAKGLWNKHLKVIK